MQKVVKVLKLASVPCVLNTCPTNPQTRKTRVLARSFCWSRYVLYTEQPLSEAVICHLLCWTAGCTTGYSATTAFNRFGTRQYSSLSFSLWTPNCWPTLRFTCLYIQRVDKNFLSICSLYVITNSNNSNSIMRLSSACTFLYTIYTGYTNSSSYFYLMWFNILSVVICVDWSCSFFFDRFFMEL